MTTEAPRRAYVLTLEIGADSRDELCAALRQLEFQVHADQLTSGVSGGPGSGYTYNLIVDESITHDSYFAAVDAWLDEQKEAKDAEG